MQSLLMGFIVGLALGIFGTLYFVDVDIEPAKDTSAEVILTISNIDRAESNRTAETLERVRGGEIGVWGSGQ